MQLLMNRHANVAYCVISVVSKLCD